MKPAPFAYTAPTTVDEACRLLDDPGTTVLAGGQTLVPLLARRRVRPSLVCDITRIPELSEVALSDGHLVIGSMVRQRDVELNPVVREKLPLLAEAISTVGFPGIRHRGTLGGSIAWADPGAEIPAAAGLLEARITLRTRTATRVVSIADFFLGGFRTVIGRGELLTQISFPISDVSVSYASVKLRPSQDRPLGCVAQYSHSDDGRIRDPRVVVFGARMPAERLTEAESVLRGARPSSSLFAAVGEAGSANLINLPGALSPAGFRRRLAAEAISRALLKAQERVDRDVAP